MVDHYKSIENKFSDVEGSIRALIGFILRSEISSCTVFNYPRVLKEHEHEGYHYIPVTPVTGKEAEAKAIMALGQFRGESLASTKSVFRLPGVISINTPQPEQLGALLSSVNSAKTSFIEAAKAIPEDERFDVIHQAFPRLIYLQVTRHLNWHTGSLQAVNFTWGTSASITKITRDEALIRVAGLLQNQKISYQEAETDTSTLNSMPGNAELRLKRDVKVRPLININHGKLVPDRYKRKEGHLPLIVINSDEFKTGVLKDYIAEIKRKKRSDTKIGEHPILSSLNVYAFNHQ